MRPAQAVENAIELCRAGRRHLARRGGIRAPRASDDVERLEGIVLFLHRRHAHVIVVRADRDELSAERRITARNDADHVASRGARGIEAHPAADIPAERSGSHRGEGSAHHRVTHRAAHVQEADRSEHVGEIDRRLGRVIEERISLLHQWHPVRRCHAVKTDDRDGMRRAEPPRRRLTRPAPPRLAGSVLRHRQHDHLARGLLRDEHRWLAKHATVDRLDVVERLGRAADVVLRRHEVLAVDDNRLRARRDQVQHRHALEISAILTAGLHAHSAQLVGDVLRGLVVARRAGFAARHGIVGVDVDAMPQVGSGDRGHGRRRAGRRRPGRWRRCRCASREGGRRERHRDAAVKSMVHDRVLRVSLESWCRWDTCRGSLVDPALSPWVEPDSSQI